jgi:hypothetical protein
MFGTPFYGNDWSGRRARVGAPPRLHAARTEDDTGWRTADLMWEQVQERAGLDCRRGQPEAALARWDEGLQIASACFAQSDPRHAASLVNVALGLQLRGFAQQADQAFDRALFVWSESWRWLARADLERAEAEDLIRSAKARTLALRRRRPLAAEDRLGRWLELRREPFGDLRKLHAAVLLSAPEIGRSEMTDDLPPR